MTWGDGRGTVHSSQRTHSGSVGLRRMGIVMVLALAASSCSSGDSRGREEERRSQGALQLPSRGTTTSESRSPAGSPGPIPPTAKTSGRAKSPKGPGIPAGQYLYDVEFRLGGGDYPPERGTEELLVQPGRQKGARMIQRMRRTPMLFKPQDEVLVRIGSRLYLEEVVVHSQDEQGQPVDRPCTYDPPAILLEWPLVEGNRWSSRSTCGDRDVIREATVGPRRRLNVARTAMEGVEVKGSSTNVFVGGAGTVTSRIEWSWTVQESTGLVLEWTERRIAGDAEPTTTAKLRSRPA